MRALGIRFLRVVESDARRWPVIEQRLHRLLAEPAPRDRRFTAVARRYGRKLAG